VFVEPNPKLDCCTMGFTCHFTTVEKLTEKGKGIVEIVFFGAFPFAE